MVIHFNLSWENEGQQQDTPLRSAIDASEYGTEGQTLFWIPI